MRGQQANKNIVLNFNPLVDCPRRLAHLLEKARGLFYFIKRFLSVYALKDRPIPTVGIN